MSPIAGRVVDFPQCVDGVFRVRRRIGHEKTGRPQSATKIVHFRVYKHRRQMLDSQTGTGILVTQGFREALNVRLRNTELNT